MYNFKYLFFGLLLCIFHMNCSSDAQQPKLIEIYYNDGFHAGHVFIASSLDSMNDVIESDPYLNKVVGTDYPARYLMSQPSVNYLYTYINANCTTKNSANVEKGESFGIISYNNDSRQKCYLFDDKEVVEYFEGMISWIKKSDNSSEFNDFIEQLNLFISNRK